MHSFRKTSFLLALVVLSFASNQAQSSEPQSLSLVAREVHLRQLLSFLSISSHKNIVISDTAKGYVTIDLENVSPEHAIDTIIKMKMLEKRYIGSIMIVAKSGFFRKLKNSYRLGQERGKEISLYFYWWNLHDALWLFSEFSGRAIIAPRRLTQNVHIVTRKTPWDQALGAVLMASGYQMVITKDEIQILPKGSGKSRESLKKVRFGHKTSTQCHQFDLDEYKL